MPQWPRIQVATWAGVASLAATPITTRVRLPRGVAHTGAMPRPVLRAWIDDHHSPDAWTQNTTRQQPSLGIPIIPRPA